MGKNAIGLSNTLVPMAMKAGYSGLIPWSDIAEIGIAYNSYLSAFFGAGGSMTKITAFIGSILGPKGFIAGIVIGAVGSVFLIDQMGRRELFY